MKLQTTLSINERLRTKIAEKVDPEINYGLELKPLFPQPTVQSTANEIYSATCENLGKDSWYKGPKWLFDGGLV
jgi:hypothetical protein